MPLNQTSPQYSPARRQSSFKPSGPADATLSFILLSLSNNQLCGLDRDVLGNLTGAYTAEGIIHIAEALKVNKTLQSIE